MKSNNFISSYCTTLLSVMAKPKTVADLTAKAMSGEYKIHKPWTPRVKLSKTKSSTPVLCDDNSDDDMGKVSSHLCYACGESLSRYADANAPVECSECKRMFHFRCIDKDMQELYRRSPDTFERMRYECPYC